MVLHDKYAILAGIAGTQPALCAGTAKHQFAIFPRFEFYVPSWFMDLPLEPNTRRKIKFEAGEDHKLAFCCAGTKSRLCAGFASQNSVLVV